MNRSRSLVTLVATAVLTGAIGTGTALGGGERGQPSQARSDLPAWQQALLAHSDALNRKYGLGRYARRQAEATEPAWLRALKIQSDALNRRYRLGEYAPRS